MDLVSRMELLIGSARNVVATFESARFSFGSHGREDFARDVEIHYEDAKAQRSQNQQICRRIFTKVDRTANSDTQPMACVTPNSTPK